MHRTDPRSPPVRGAVTAGSACGPRPYQEDRFVVEAVDLGGLLRGHLLAVLDGHGGDEAAALCAGALVPAFLQAAGGGAEEALRAAVDELGRLTAECRTGTTLAAALVLEPAGLAVVAVLGDSVALVVDARGRTVRSPEHNGRSNPAEREAALARGGVWDPSGYLRNPATGYAMQLTRALGDAVMGDVVCRRPETYTVALGPESVVVLATDGVFDPSHAGGDAAEDALRLRGPGRPLTAQRLLAWAERRGLRDNATAVVWDAIAGGEAAGSNP